MILLLPEFMAVRERTKRRKPNPLPGFEIFHLFVAGRKFSCPYLLAKSLIGGDVLFEIRALLYQEVGNHASEYDFASTVKMRTVTTREVIFLGIILADGVDVVGACEVQVKPLDTGRLRRSDSLAPPVVEILDDLAVLEVTTRQGGNYDLCRGMH